MIIKELRVKFIKHNDGMSQLSQEWKDIIRATGFISLELAVALKKLNVQQKSLATYAWWTNTETAYFHSHYIEN